MTTRKRNEFLDIESEDEAGDDRGYDSEAAEETKGRASTAGRASKRRRLSSDEERDEDEEASEAEDDEDENEDENEDADGKAAKKTSKSKEKTKTNNDDDHDLLDDNDAHSITSHGASSTTSSKTKSKLLAPSKKKNKTGVIYFSSLPPYLKPSALKSLLLARGFGPITKVFLTPAVRSSSSSGKKSNRRKTYTDGWVEFASKKVAKVCAETLNANTVGGRGFYRDDVWNMKYLKGFKWADLMEQVQRERGEREARRRIEDARARKEEKAFLAGVEKGKVVEGIRKKKEEKKKAKAAENGDARDVQELQVRRVFRQNEVRTKANRDERALGEDAKRVLGKIF